MESSILRLALACALCAGVSWDVCEASTGGSGDEEYRNFWERAQPDNGKKPLSPMSSEKEQLDACKPIPDNMKFDCYPLHPNQTVCEKRGCCWKKPDTKGAPYCYYPTGYNTFRFVKKTENKEGIRVTYSRDRPSGYPGDFANVVLEFKYLSDDTLQFKIYDADKKRFESPVPRIPANVGPISNLQYRVQIDNSVGFKVIRNSDNVTIINTKDVGALILSDRFLQISTLLPTDRIFGFGEQMDHLKRNITWRTYSMFNRDQGTTKNANLYGTHPFYLGVEKNGKSHGMFLLNTNAMDVVLQPTPALTYRTVGGILNFVLFMGPTPQQVLSQYTAVIGRPHMPPYWALGFHLCRFGYNTLNNTRKIWKANRDAGIPFDVQWNDIDYMYDKEDFTYDHTRFKGLPEFVKELHDAGMHYVMIFDPGQSASNPRGKFPPYDRGVEMNVFVKNSKDKPFVGHVWNPTTVFPDFTHPNATSYWTEMMTGFHKQVNYDGAWLDMNEPSNRWNVDKCEPLQLPYTPHWLKHLSYNTLCMDARHHIGPHYDVHNLYSLYHSISTYESDVFLKLLIEQRKGMVGTIKVIIRYPLSFKALKQIRGKRPFVLSRSTFPGSGSYAAHWTGDNGSWWEHMRYSIYDILNFSLFGIPFVGADICGFGYDASKELCKRWMQLGAFYPFSRNHNFDQSKAQDPVSLGPEVVDASRTALRLRYRLLPYYYTLFWEAHTKGHTVATPVFFLSPNDPQLDIIENQFLIGRHVLISAIVEEHANTTHAFFPGPNKWYNIVTGEYLASNQYLNITDRDMVSVQGGAILPLQEPAPSGPVTTTNTRTRPLQLLAVPDHKRTAAGQLYWDDGDSTNSLEEKKYCHIEFTLKDEALSSKVVLWGYSVPSVNKIAVLGQTRPIKTVTLNDKAVKFEYNDKSKLLNVNDINLTLDKPFTVKWTY